ncbi:SAP DOMAIN-CONTAINING PROTEIN-RELATED [Salix purpurea]|uniref:SAP DOMAIN-CONTAINING PROTEIN-RELATED n=1 Tax=Salix purpurea TaxID=77065 RepID=A0A9Q0PNL3_SALPP|nr:SAP DOMAIN-CONTAINING PROTEIN-RELATED [Salix purpurea]
MAVISSYVVQASESPDKLGYFRIKELKNVLTLLGLSKQGKKQDLVDRILAILSDGQVSKIWAKKSAIGKEEAAKLVDDTYRKMQVSGATDLASKGLGTSNCCNSKFNVEIDEPFHSDTKVRCPCGTSLETELMIKVKRSFSSESSSIISYRCAYSMDGLYGTVFTSKVSLAWS